MCVNSKEMKCCGSCSLTDATIVLGVLYVLFAIGSAASQQWFNFAMGLLASFLFIMVCVKKHDVNVRKALFVLVTILQTLSVIGFIVAFGVILSTDYVEEMCVDLFWDDPQSFVQSFPEGVEQCESYINTFIYIIFGVGLII